MSNVFAKTGKKLESSAAYYKQQFNSTKSFIDIHMCMGFKTVTYINPIGK